MGSKFDALKSVDEDVVEKLKKYKKENAVLKSQNFDKDQQFQEAAKLAEHKRQKQLGENAILRAALEKDAPGSAEAVVATGMDGTIRLFASYPTPPRNARAWIRMTLSLKKS